MENEVKQETTQVEPVPATAPAPKLEYDLHIQVAGEMRQTLRLGAELAYKLGDIPKPDLVNLMNLFISWGMTVLKNKWLERVGYH